MKKILVFTIALLTSGSLYSQNIYNGALYGGFINNETDMNNTKYKDDGYMGGVYFQMINTEHFQFNDFLYGSKDINDSDTIGNHFIFDYYPLENKFGKFVTGAGIEYINIKTDTTEIDLENNVFALYGRIGQYFNFDLNENIELKLLPWGGYQTEIIDTDGDLTIVIPGPAPDIYSDLSDNSKNHYLMSGINISITYAHFLQMKLKYNRKFDFKEKYYPDSVSAMMNVYFTKNIGLSYRFKYMEMTTGKNLYNLIGITCVINTGGK